MATPIDWHGSNKILKAPKGTTSEQVQDLPTFNNGVCSVSCWQLSPDELAEVVQNGGRVFVSVFSGDSQYPMYVGIESEVRELVVDYGAVWKK